MKALQIKIEMAQANGPTNNQQQACEITIQGLWAQTGKFFVLDDFRWWLVETVIDCNLHW